MPTRTRHSAEQRLQLLQSIAARLTADMSLKQILSGVADILRQAFDWDYVGCASVDPEHGCLRFEAHASTALDLELGQHLPLGDGIVGEVAQRGVALRIDDVLLHRNFVDMVPGTRSELCVPVLHQGEVIAVLDAQSRQPFAFDAGAQATLSLVAELLGGHMAAARQLEAARQRADLIGLLAEVSRTMLAEDDLDAMLQRLIDELHRCFSLTLSSLCLRDPDSGELLLRAFAGATGYPLQRGRPWPREHGITGRAMRSGKRVFVPDVRLDPDYIEGNPASIAELVVPIRFRGEPLGFINLESPSAARFSPANQLAVQALADQVAGSIRLAQTKQTLEQVNAAATAVSAELARSNRSLALANRKLEQLNLRDPLTGLGNRRCFDRSLRERWRELGREHKPLALLLLDIDHYKAYNDHYGHSDGDLCLQRVARLLQRSCRHGEAVLARYGGEEFAVILPGADADRAQAVAARIQAGLRRLALPHAASPVAPRLTCSIGIAVEIPQAPREPGDLIRAADAALYAAKRDGRDRTVLAASA